MAFAPVSGSEMLARVAEELAACGPELEQLGELLASLTAADGGTGARTIQAADRLAQTMTAVSDVVRRLASAAPSDWKVEVQDVAADVGLNDLVQRLNGCSQSRADTSGELEIF